MADYSKLGFRNLSISFSLSSSFPFFTFYLVDKTSVPQLSVVNYYLAQASIYPLPKTVAL